MSLLASFKIPMLSKSYREVNNNETNKIMSNLLFREDAYLKSCLAKVVSHGAHSEIELDQTIFYANAGGQPGDKGLISWNGQKIEITNTIYSETKNVIHIPTEGSIIPPIGASVELEIDWIHRHRIMRCHTMMHLLCAAVPFPVTGSSITADGGRIDFDIPEGQIPNREILTATINNWIKEDHSITTQWITDEELDAKPELVRTLLVKPPRGSGKVRLVLIGENGKIDLQPCGGTHVNSTAEIGEIAVDKIQNKGKINRRIRLVLVQP
jgi:misacylated tRNA(Ala) deacylase